MYGGDPLFTKSENRRFTGAAEAVKLAEKQMLLDPEARLGAGDRYEGARA